MPDIGLSIGSVRLPIGTVSLSVSQEWIGACTGTVAIAAAALTLTISGGRLGPSISAGSMVCAALDLAMLVNMGASEGSGQIAGTVDRRLAEYVTVSPAVPGSPATLVLDFTLYDGSSPWTLQLSGDTQAHAGGGGNPGVPNAPMPVYADWTGADGPGAAEYTYTSNDNQDTEAYTGPSDTNIVPTFTQGVADIAEVVSLVHAASEGFVIDTPLWLGTHNLALAGSGNGILRGTEKAVSLWEVGKEVYSLWGYEIADLRTIEYGRASIVNWCNAAMQLIYSNAHRLDYFNREVLELTVTTSGTVALPANVQQIQGPARIGSAVLSTLASRAEYDHFAALYVGDSTLASPIAFYVEPLRGTGSDSVGLSLNLVPFPTGTVTVRLDVTLEPPRYDVVDLMQATILQLPHKWAETIFLPIVRKWACADSRMGNSRRAAVMPQIDEQFAAARQMLGLADIEPPAQAKTKPEKQQGGAA